MSSHVLELCAMNAKQFLEQFPAEAETVAVAAGTNYVYFTQLASGFRKAGPKLAGRLEAASEGRMTRADLRPDYFGGLYAAKSERKRA